MKKSVGILEGLTGVVSLLAALAGLYAVFKAPDAAPANSPISNVTQSTAGKNSPIINSTGANATVSIGDTQK